MRGKSSCRRAPYHITDKPTRNRDIIGLLTLGKAEKGGLSQLSSVGQLYNTFSGSRRDILRTLASKYYSR
jgi:hypothetical protein